jgi:hypothetical protein
VVNDNYKDKDNNKGTDKKDKNYIVVLFHYDEYVVSYLSYLDLVESIN